MGRTLFGVIGTVAAVALAVAAGAALAAGPPVVAAVAPAEPAAAARWWDVADVALRVATLVVLSGGLIGTFAVLTSLRSNTYSQIYSRFQTMLLKLADHPEWFERMRHEEYSDADDAPVSSHRFIANAMVNLYEEAFLLYDSRVLAVIDTVPDDYWQSMLGSMRSAFRLRYVRTHWERRQAVFSGKFNAFVRDEILAKIDPM